jgi:NitT/TauT family transport system permease protein
VSLAAPAIAGPRRGRDATALRALALRYLPPAAVFLAGIALWEVATAGTGRRVIPPPTTILAAGLDNLELLWRSTQATFYEAIGGLVIGTVGGVAVSFASARWVTARDVLLPVAIGSSAIPIIAVAPILNNWFGVLNPLSKMAMAALLVFFPVLMVGTTLSFIGALVGEYFGGTSEVLGRVVLTSMSSGSFGLAWAGILIGAMAAIAAYLVVSLVERVSIPWYAALRAEG